MLYVYRFPYAYILKGMPFIVRAPFTGDGTQALYTGLHPQPFVESISLNCHSNILLPQPPETLQCVTVPSWGRPFLCPSLFFHCF